MSTIIVPREEQAAYALKRYKIADLSVLPADWHPETHYPDGRPLTPTVKERQGRLVTEDGAWLVADEPAVDCDTPYGSPPSSPETWKGVGRVGIGKSSSWRRRSIVSIASFSRICSSSSSGRV